MFADSHVGPIRSQKSDAGVTVRVKSRFGFCWSASLNTLLSTPMFVNEIVGLTRNGPMAMRTFAGSGSPFTACCAAADHGRSAARNTSTRMIRFTKGNTSKRSVCEDER